MICLWRVLTFHLAISTVRGVNIQGYTKFRIPLSKYQQSWAVAVFFGFFEHRKYLL